jgi:hypothetical protein
MTPQPDAVRYEHLFAPNDASVTDYLQSALFDLTTFEGGTAQDRAIDKISRALGILAALKETWQPQQPPSTAGE